MLAWWVALTAYNCRIELKLVDVIRGLDSTVSAGSGRSRARAKRKFSVGTSDIVRTIKHE